MKDSDMPVIIVTNPKIMVNFSCAYCSKKYSTTDIRLVHSCKNCVKEQNISNVGYSLDAISFYIGIIILKFKNRYRLKLQYTNAYLMIVDSIISHLDGIGIKIKEKNDNVVIHTLNNKKEITITEIILEKIGAIR